MPHHFTPKFVARFWSNVDRSQTDGCWAWTKAKMPNGYGKVANKPTNQCFLVHRISYELTYGTIPDGMLVCHRCDNRLCVRPDHLFLGTAKENTQDAVQKGRMPHGERQYRSKLTAEQVIEIRAKYVHRYGILTELGKEYNVSHGTIYDVVNRLCWKHI